MLLQTQFLEKVLTSLIKGMIRAKTNPADLEIRDGCIQRFEYTYELTIKLMKRYIESESPVTNKVDQMNFRDFMRVSAEMGLIKQVENWFIFREVRNQTSHAYDESKAVVVFNAIPDFVEHAQSFLTELQRRIQRTV